LILKVSRVTVTPCKCNVGTVLHNSWFSKCHVWQLHPVSVMWHSSAQQLIHINN